MREKTMIAKKINEKHITMRRAASKRNGAAWVFAVIKAPFAAMMTPKSIKRHDKSRGKSPVAIREAVPLVKLEEPQ